MRISERCYAVTGLGYSTPWCVNAGFIVGDERTLIIDTGANAYAGETILGYALAVKPSNQLLVINTEKHFDHILGNCVFRRHGCAIWGHPGVKRTEEQFRSERLEINEAFFYGTDLCMPDHHIERAMSFDSAEVIFTPGHTETNLSVWLPSEGVLFTGDCLISQYAPNLSAGAPADWRIWLESLARIEALKPEIVVAGHGPVVRGPSAVARMIDGVRQVLTTSLNITGA